MFWRSVVQLTAQRTAVVECILLRLSASGFFAQEQVNLSNADLAEQAEQPVLRFSLSGDFAADASLATRSSLQRLGAEGMARRMEMLVQEGLVK